MKKYSSLKIFSGKVVAAMLAASMLIGNVGAMKPAVTSPEFTSWAGYRAEHDRYEAQFKANEALREATKFKSELCSDPMKRQIISTVYFLVTMDQQCEKASQSGVNPIILRNAIKQTESAFQNNPYFRYVKAFSEEHPYEFKLVLAK